ncbi:MAG: hypothetical protein O3A00_25470 [Planctomycetota bacterium]|nr:hypothetical protein [Planctomycetota bacterium]
MLRHVSPTRVAIICVVLFGMVCAHVESLRAQQPKSPFIVEPQGLNELFDAIALSVKLARPQLARQYLEKFLALQPTDDQLLKIRDKHGPALFLKFSNIREMQPEGRQLLDRVNAAFSKRGIDPLRVDKFIDALAGDPSERRVAFEALRGGGPFVVPQILKKMETDPIKRAIFMSSLIRFGRQIVPPLLGAMNSPSQSIREAAIEALGYMQTVETIPYLWAPAFDPNENPGTRTLARASIQRIRAGRTVGSFTPSVLSDVEVANALRKTAERHFRNDYEWPTNEDGTVDIWTWSTPKETLELLKVTPYDASLFVGQQFARQSLAFHPDNLDVQSLFLGFALAREARVAGWNRAMANGPGTAFNLALRSGADVTSRILTQALADENDHAARGALQVLSQIGGRELLATAEGHESPLMTALDYPDSRIRMLASTTILQLDPVSVFSGSHKVVRELMRSISDGGVSRAVVADANSDRARTIAGRLAEQGYDAITVSSGRDAFRAASERGDVTIIMLEMNIARWALTQTIVNLRADARTRRIPIIVFGDPSRAAIIEKQLEKYALTAFVEYATTTDFFRSQVDPFLKSVAAVLPTPEQRNQQTIAAAYWFAEIASTHATRVFDVTVAQAALSEAINDPSLAANAIIGLSAVPSKFAQTRIADVVTNPNAELPLRIRAAAQLAFHIQRFGLKLPDDRINLLKLAAKLAVDTNQPELATSLDSVLGSMRPSAPQVQKALQQFRLPLSPVVPQPAAP